MTSNTISEQVRDLKWKLCSRDTENNWHTTPDKNEMYTGVSVECGDYLKVSSSCLWSAIKFGGGGEKGGRGGRKGEGGGGGGSLWAFNISLQRLANPQIDRSQGVILAFPSLGLW